LEVDIPVLTCLTRGAGCRVWRPSRRPAVQLYSAHHAGTAADEVAARQCSHMDADTENIIIPVHSVADPRSGILNLLSPGSVLNFFPDPGFDTFLVRFSYSFWKNLYTVVYTDKTGLQIFISTVPVSCKN
jgi:hypothetical protein